MKTVEITIPAYNEESELENNITKLCDYCNKHLKMYKWHITIVDNASTDKTALIARKLKDRNKNISLRQLTKRGRGNAVKTAWRESKADYYVYMDVDLSTDLSHLPGLIQSLDKGYDIAIGSRLKDGAKVIERSVKREFISRVYNLLIKILFHTQFSDAQCGFKAVEKKVVSRLLPSIKDDQWFMDTELLIMAEKMGYRIYEIPVIWRDNPGSTVRILPTAIGDLKGLLRLVFTRPWNRPH